MTDPEEVASSILLLFFGGGIIVAVYSAFYGGNITTVTNVITAFAVPVTIFAIIVWFGLSILSMEG